MDNEILGCYVSTSTDAKWSEGERDNAFEKGRLFRRYIWGDKGICKILEKLKYLDYGNSLSTILFQFYVNPIPYELKNIDDIEKYRRKEKSIGIPIVVNNINFFNKSEEGRYNFLKQSILQKIDLLYGVVILEKLDTKIDILKSDIQKLFD